MPDAQQQPRDFAKLHFIVVLWGFTAVLGRLIDLESTVIVLYRVLVAGAILTAILVVRRVPGGAPRRALWPLFANGLLLGLHWILFFLAVEIANVSVCMIGLATSTLWTAALEPAMVKTRRFRTYEFALGGVMIGAIALIAGGDFQYRLGLLVAVASAGVGTTFSIINSRLTHRHHHHVISLYQMLGAATFCTVTVTALSLARGGLPDLAPSARDVGLLFLLASVCTVYAYSQYIELLKRLTVFTVHLAYNLEPVYGILLAALFFREHEDLGPYFYLGAAIILAAVVAQPFVERVYRRRLRRAR